MAEPKPTDPKLTADEFIQRSTLSRLQRLREQQQAEAAAAAPPAPAAPTAPAGPFGFDWSAAAQKAAADPAPHVRPFEIALPELPATDLNGALAKYQEALVQNYMQFMPEAEARDAAARAYIRSGLDPAMEPPVPETPGYLDSIYRAFSPRVITDDNRPLSPLERLQAQAKGVASAGIDAVPHLRALEALQVPQRVEGAGKALEQSAPTGSDLASKVLGGIQRGTGRAIQGVVPDAYSQGLAEGKSTGEAVTGVSSDTLRDLGEFGAGLSEAGAGLRAEAPGSYDPMTAIGKTALGDLASGVGGVLQAPNALMELARPARPPVRQSDQDGLRVETPLLAAVRVLGSTGEAAGITALKRVPLPISKSTAGELGIRKDIREPLPEDAGLLDRILYELEPVTVAEAVGAPAGMTQSVRRDVATGPIEGMVPAPIRNSFQEFLERVEKGQGLEEEGGAIGEAIAGPEGRKYGYRAGMAVSMLTPWEAPGAHLASRTFRLAQEAKAVQRFTGAGKLESLSIALTTPLSEVGATYGRQLSERLEAGDIKWSDIPEDLYPYMDAVAKDQFKMAPEEVAAAEGLYDMRQAPVAPTKARADSPEMQKMAMPVVTKGGEAERRLDAPAVKEAGREVLDPNRAAPGNLYVVRTALDAPVGWFRTIDEAYDFMAARRVRGDTMWRSGHQPIARWTDGELAPDALGRAVAAEAEHQPRSWIQRTEGADGHDAAVLDHLSERDLAGGEGLRKLRDPFPENAAAGRVLTDLEYGYRTSPGGPRTTTGKIIEDAARLLARDKYGSEYLTWLPTGAKVTLADEKRIMGAVDRELSGVGLGRKDAAQVVTAKKPLDKAQVRSLAAKYGMKEMPDVTTPAGYRDLVHAGVKYHGGALSLAAAQVKGMPGLTDAMRQWLATFHQGRELGKAGVKPPWRNWLGKVSKAFFDDPVAGLPANVEAALRKSRNRLERVPDDFLQQTKAVVNDLRARNAEAAMKRGGVKEWAKEWARSLTDAEIAHVYKTIFEDEIPLLVTEDSFKVVNSVRTDGLKGRALDIARQIEDELPPWAKGTKDPKVAAAAVSQWVGKQEGVMYDVARDFVEATMASAGKAIVRDSTDWNWLMNITDDTLIELYGESMLGADIIGPTMKRLLVERGFVQDAAGNIEGVNPTSVFGSFIVKRRHSAEQSRLMQELLDTNAAQLDDTMWIQSHQQKIDETHPLEQVRSGRAYTKNANGQWVSTLPPTTRAWAEHALRSWGLPVGRDGLMADAAFEPARIGQQRRVLAPSYLKDRIEAALTAGQLGAGALSAHMRGIFGFQTPGEVYAAAYQAFKRHNTIMSYGLVARPAYLLGQVLSLSGSSLWTTRGLMGAAKATPNILANAIPWLRSSKYTGLTGELSMRLSKPDPMVVHHAPSNPLNSVLVDKNGQPWTMDELERLARDGGLADSIVKYELGRHFDRVILGETSTIGRALWGWQAYQDMVQDYAAGFDQTARVHVFLEEIERGTPPMEAAARAKSSALDFRSLTEFEAKYMRNIFTFYAYMRKAADQFLYALLTNPDRVAQQMRFAHKAWTTSRTPAQQRGWNQENVDEDVGRIWMRWAEEEYAVNSYGEVNPRWHWTPASTPSLSTESLRILMLPMSPQNMLDSGSPLVALGGAAMYGQRGGRDIEADSANVVPNIVADVFTLVPDLGETMFGMWPVPTAELNMDPTDQSDSATAAMNGTPAVWVAGADPTLSPSARSAARLAWQAFVIANGSGPNNLEGWRRTLGILGGRPRRDLTRADEAMHLLGLTQRKEPTTPEAINKAALEQQRAIEEATKEVKPKSTDR